MAEFEKSQGILSVCSYIYLLEMKIPTSLNFIIG